MYIELTDHLRCTADHEEAYLVLLPSVMDGRLVTEGVLGCPICHRAVPVAGGRVDFGGGTPGAGTTTLTAEAAHALLGLDGPGGYLVLVGGAGTMAAGVSALLPGIRCIAVNPPEATDIEGSASILRAGRLPIKQASMRGAVISADHAADPAWLADTIASVLPGLRVVGEGPAPERAGVTIMAEAGGWWVGKR